MSCVARDKLSNICCHLFSLYVRWTTSVLDSYIKPLKMIMIGFLVPSVLRMGILSILQRV